MNRQADRRTDKQTNRQTESLATPEQYQLLDSDKPFEVIVGFQCHKSE